MCRVNAYIRNGWDKQLIDPDLSQATSTASLCGTTSNFSTAAILPTDGWEDINKLSDYNSSISALTH